MADPQIITDPAAVTEYLRSGNAKVTLRSNKTGTRYTYKITAPGKRTDKGGFTKDYDAKVRFASLLVGSDNERDYQFIGSWFADSPWLSAGRKGNDQHPAFKALSWVIGMANQCANRGEDMPDTVEVWHEGTCGRCGRALTDPASIARGLGPECATK